MKKHRTYIFLFSLLLICCSCVCKAEKDIIPSYSNGSGYRWKLLKANNIVSDSLWVQINIRNKNNDFIENGTTAVTGCKKINVENGQSTLLLRKIDVESVFRASSVGYFVVETKPILLQENDSVIIDFILAEDNRPLINCE